MYGKLLVRFDRRSYLADIGGRVRSPKRTRTVKIDRPIQRAQKLPWPRLSEDEPAVPLGVDIIEKRQDIVKLVYKFFRVEGISMDELLQEVYVAILHKNQTRSAHDPRKSSFGHYVYMVANNVCINLVHKKRRYDKEKDYLDAPCRTEDGSTTTNLDMIEDCGFLNLEVNETDYVEEFETLLRKNGEWELARYVRAVRNGAKPEIIREALSCGSKKYSTKMVRDLRARMKDAVLDLNF
jgi:DNA-directed RNA polymerase specialized sigma24 family protein